MINAEQIYYKAQSLDAVRLQELGDFLEFLLSKNKAQHKPDVVFSETQLEATDAPSVYQGRRLTDEELKQAIALVPQLPLGNPEGEALASQDGKLELPAPNSQAGAWELAKPASRIKPYCKPSWMSFMSWLSWRANNEPFRF